MISRPAAHYLMRFGDEVVATQQAEESVVFAPIGVVWPPEPEETAEDRQAESAFGDEGVAGDKFKGAAGGVGLAFKIASEDPDFAGVFETDLRGAEHVAGGMEGNADAVQIDGLAIFQRVDGCAFAHASAQDVEAVLGGEISLRAGAGVVGMGVGDDSSGHRAPGVDVEIADGAIEAGAGVNDKRVGCHLIRPNES